MKNNSEKKQNIIAEDAQKASSAVLRKCVACGKIAQRDEFIRILTDYKTGKVIINPNNKEFGRSSYICKNIECLKLSIKKKRLKTLSDEDFNIIASVINTL